MDLLSSSAGRTVITSNFFTNAPLPRAKLTLPFLVEDGRDGGREGIGRKNTAMEGSDDGAAVAAAGCSLNPYMEQISLNFVPS